ncbi:glycosyl transferase family 1 [Methanosarcina mazei]|uniref:Glycosyl transferase family 1 n=2 Tax=Methanosarcina mazei TaxID=2209 RepID=A0A0F8NAR8_METMZ|nr:glycosyltransferase [Methanosarcina mazei]KKG07101.1 glycosyl transferase family 1 [Methanosarcina mazei]KKH38035.1 glycosyl transferase family 1 [Methanosarcina mazei]KKH38395.1 glycosyl transferase family 1 [Methanosarcina mazei]KKH45994.1 glycosyl transferase family 1 [Methanosarcina mazei]KKH54233.1 glycosyl transferase family 1 [Methanosarcina mazei]
MRSKNLLILTNNFPNADDSYVAEIFVKEQVKCLKNYFQTVYVISPVAYGMERLRKTIYRDYQYDNVKVFFPKYFNIPLFYTYLRFLWVYLEKKAILKQIERKGINFDLIHAHFTWPSGAVAVKLKKYFNVPLIITEHTSNTFQRSIDKKDKMFINTWKMCDAIMRVRQKDIFLFEYIGITKNKVFHIPNGFNHSSFFLYDTFECRKRLNLPKNKKIILNVGNLYSEVKGHKYLIEAINIIVKNRKDILCVVVGSGKLESNLRGQIANLELEDHIKLVGSKPHGDISLWINACDVFVLPSLNEGNPTVMFECLGCGKPFIGTKVGGIPEVIVSNDYGLLVEPGNAQDLAEKIEIALNKNWDEGNILNYAKQYRWENITSQMVTIYDELCSRNSNLKSA